jgi:hypothetical protein
MILSVSNDALYACLSQLNGLELSRAREVCKKIKTFIKKHESAFYYSCMTREYPAKVPIYAIPGYFRPDWKNIYILTDQYAVTQKHARKNKAIIKYQKTFEKVALILSVFELCFDAFSGMLNGLKVGLGGWRAQRDFINAFCAANPEKTVQDAHNAFKAIGALL